MPAQTANAALKRNLSEHEAKPCSVLVYTSAACRGAIVHGEVSRAIYIEARTSITVPTRKVLHFRSNPPGNNLATLALPGWPASPSRREAGVPLSSDMLE
jgi:hypothetical protein